MLSRKITKATVLISFLLFIGIVIIINSEPIRSLDEGVLNFMSSIQNPNAVNLGIIIGYLFGNVQLTVILLIISGYFIFYHPKLRRDYYILVGVMVINFLAVLLLKFFIERPRPISALITLNNYSFPSGHTASTIVFFGLLLCFIWKKYEFFHWVLGFFAISVVGIVAFSRLYLQVHWFSDILGGLFLGLFFISLALHFINLEKN